MTRRVHIEEILHFLEVDDPEILAAMRSEGLFEQEEIPAEEAEELRVATCLMRDLGVNAAGVGVILHLRRRLLTLQTRMTDALRDLLDDLNREREGGRW